MKTSRAGLDLIKTFEGCRLEAYGDVAGVLTLGFGHTGPDVHAGMEITQEQADILLAQDLEEAEEVVGRLTRSVTLNQNQFDALISFEFNTGALAHSTLLKQILMHNFDGAAKEFVRWDHAGGVEVPGLFRRRSAEQALFRKAVA